MKGEQCFLVKKMSPVPDFKSQVFLFSIILSAVSALILKGGNDFSKKMLS